MKAVRVTTGGRLHFGLLRLPPSADWPDDGRAYFGGAGLMIDSPGLAVRVEQRATWSAEGKLGPRALAAGRRYAAAIDCEQAFGIQMVQESPQHIGLGTGTQLELAVAAGLSRLLGRADTPAELAKLLGRGRRSAIGVHGFELGGFLIDAGKRRPDELSALNARLEWSSSWPIVLLTPREAARWHGYIERDAFATIGDQIDRNMPPLLTAMTDAVNAQKLAEFGRALSEYNARAGELFRAVQGGRYSQPLAESMIGWLVARGAAGAGQSSWGPTVFGIAADLVQAGELQAEARRQWGDAIELQISAGQNQGAAMVEL